MKMVFHFSRVADSDITVEGATPGECYQKAVEERAEQFKAVCFPTTGGKTVVPDPSLVTPK
jgi:hypothetical protein